MKRFSNILIFGEVLFDCFPTGEEVLGGAPFNVAWHLQAFGDSPRMITRVGDDAQGETILAAMKAWGMDLSDVQLDPRHPSGRVDVKVIDNEPHYTITPDCAYDFIDADALEPISGSGILYHGTLGIRNDASRRALMQLADNPNLSLFIDVNLRPPWWQKEEVCHWLQKATWAKLNEDELSMLGFATAEIRQSMGEVVSRFGLEQLIVTRGERGAIVLAKSGAFYEVVPEKADAFVDTVGAGDAFSAVYIHGLFLGWPIEESLKVAQRFALKVIGLRGATTEDRSFYREFAQH